jgi:RNA polymerase sigma-70 factor (ECF subfamily)
MEGYGVAEAAVVLGCAEGTVKSRCSRGRARLAEMLDLLRPGRDPEHAEVRNPDPPPPVPPTSPARPAR